jgi:hypothetical protein
LHQTQVLLAALRQAAPPVARAAQSILRAVPVQQVQQVPQATMDLVHQVAVQAALEMQAAAHRLTGQDDLELQEIMVLREILEVLAILVLLEVPDLQAISQLLLDFLQHLRILQLQE